VNAPAQTSLRVRALLGILLLAGVTAAEALLLAYYCTLSLDSIDAQWQLPFMVATPLAGLAVIALVLVRQTNRRLRRWLVFWSLVAVALPLMLESLVRHWIFVR